MIVVPIDQGDARPGVPQFEGSRDAAEAGADDRHALSAVEPARVVRPAGTETQRAQKQQMVERQRARAVQRETREQKETHDRITQRRRVK